MTPELDRPILFPFAVADNGVTVTAAAQPAMSIPANLYLLGNASGATESWDLRYANFRMTE